MKVNMYMHNLINELEEIIEDPYTDMRKSRYERTKKILQELRSLVIVIGDYELSHYHAGDFWLSNKIGEGTQIDRKDLVDLIEKLFKDNF